MFASKRSKVSVEEIAASAKVSKPIASKFRRQAGLYAVVVDREMRALTDALIGSLSDTDAHPGNRGTRCPRTPHHIEEN